MVKREIPRSQVDDAHLEGMPDYGEPAESRNRFDVASEPPVRLPARGGPSGETGLIHAIHLDAEGEDRGEAQDASRTTAEYRALPVADDNGSEPPWSNALVLIIEDSVELAKLIQITLNRNAIRSIIETSGTRALQRYYEMTPDVVLLDLGLPDMTGWKVLDAIRESAKTSGVMPVVIVISAYGDSANRLVGKLQNVHGYLVKPFTTDDIISAVKQALNGKVG